MTRFIYFSLAILMTVFAQAQETKNFEWGFGLTFSSLDTELKMVTDDENNLYVTGKLRGTWNFDPQGTYELSSTDPFNDDIFVAKYSAEGDFIWAKNFGLSGNDFPYKIALDGLGNVYIVGTMSGTGDFNPGSTGGAYTSNGQDGFLLKLTTDGDFQWMQAIAGEEDNEATALACLPNGDVVVVGHFGSMELEISPNLTIDNVEGNGDMFVVKMDGLGNPLWGFGLGDGYMWTNDVEALQDGSLVIAGEYLDQDTDFDPGPGVFNMPPLSSFIDTGFLLKIDDSGNFIWARQYLTDGSSEVFEIESDASNNLFIAGEYQQETDLDPGVLEQVAPEPPATNRSGAFLSKLDTNGDMIWAYGLVSQDFSVLPFAMDVDAAGGMFLGGQFGGTADFDAGAGTAVLTHLGFGDGFALKVSQADGAFEWVKQFGATQRQRITAIQIDGDNSLLMAGDTDALLDIDPGAGVLLEGTRSFFVKLNKKGTCEDPWSIAQDDIILDTLYADASDGSDFFEFTPTTNGYVSFSACNGAGTTNDDFINVYEDNCGNLVATEVGNLSCVRSAKWEGVVSAGTTYLFEWNIDYNLGTQTDEFITPVFFYQENYQGYDCSSAKTLDCTGDFEAEFRRVGQWFEWTAPSTGTFEVGLPTGHTQVQSGGAYPLYIEVLTSCGTTYIANNDPDDDFTFREKATFSATEGQTYYIFLQNFGYVTVANNPLILELAEQGVNPVSSISAELVFGLSDRILAATKGADSYQWYNAADDQPVPDETYHKFMPESAGFYYVMASVSGCTWQSNTVEADFILGSGNDCTDIHPLITSDHGSVMDTIVVNATTGSKFFQFNPITNGFLTLSSCRTGDWDSDHRLKIYDANCNNLLSEITGNNDCGGRNLDHQMQVSSTDQFVIEFDLDPNEPVENQIDKIYEVLFYFREDHSSTDCVDALILNCEGDFEVDLRGSEQWFVWTAPVVDEYILSFTDVDVANQSLEIEAYTGTCGNLTLFDQGTSNLTIFPGTGLTLYFRFLYPYDAAINGPYTANLIGFSSPTDVNTHEVLEVVSCDEEYEFDGIFLEEEGIYHAQYLSQAGCDSVVTVVLEFSDDNFELDIESCESYDFDGQTLTASGSYFATFQNQYACDSVININLTINEPDNIVSNVATCESYEWQENTYTESGQYQVLFTNQTGCDSLMTLNLTINEPDLVVANDTAFQSYDFAGQQLLASGRYQTTLMNQNGCDSTVILNLVVRDGIGWTATGWSNVTGPTLADNAIITVDYSTLLNGAFNLAGLEVDDGATLTVSPGTTLDVNGDINNLGNIIIESGATVLTHENDYTGNGMTFIRNTRYASKRYSMVGTPVKQDANNTADLLGPIVYTYDETIPYNEGTEDGVNRWISSTNNELLPGTGYATAGQQIITITGIPNDGDVTLNLGRTEDATTGSENWGWHLVSNPYPASLDISEFLTTNEQIQGAIALWDDPGSDAGRGDNGDYLTVNAIGSIGGPNGGQFEGYIGSMQGFFVQVGDGQNGELQFTMDMRSTANNLDANFFRTTEVETFQILLSMSDDEYYSETLIGFRKDASRGIDRLYDAAKLRVSRTNNIYSIINESAYAIQGLPLGNNQKIPLGIDRKESGMVTIHLDEASNIPAGYDLKIQDNSTGLHYPISVGGSLNFSVNSGNDQLRFTLLVNERNIVSSIDNEHSGLKIYADTKHINIQSTGLKEIANIRLIDMAGRIWEAHINQKLSYQAIKIPKPTVLGVYLIHFELKGETVVKKLIIK